VLTSIASRLQFTDSPISMNRGLAPPPFLRSFATAQRLHAWKPYAPWMECFPVEWYKTLGGLSNDCRPRTCLKCSKKFIKSGGCNKMTCPCGVKMCSMWRQPLNKLHPYKHFCRTPHCDHKSCGKCIRKRTTYHQTDAIWWARVLLTASVVAAVRQAGRRAKHSFLIRRPWWSPHFCLGLSFFFQNNTTERTLSLLGNVYVSWLSAASAMDEKSILADLDPDTLRETILLLLLLPATTNLQPAYR